MWLLDRSCLFLQGQWTVPLLGHTWDSVTKDLSLLSFSSVDGAGIVAWDSLILVLLLFFLRHRPLVTFQNFPDDILSLSECYGIRELVFRGDARF